MDIKVFEKGGQLWTTSLEVAGKFGKRHDTVLRAVRNLECSEDFSRRNFAESTYRDERGKDQPMVAMSRGGFSMIAMGFTGREAVAWKEKFIAAFDQMEKTILQMAQEKEKRGQLDWQQHRAMSKEQRRETTDAIKVLIAHARNQGSTADDKLFYISYSRMIKDALFILASKTDKKWRDSLNVKQLSVISVAEFMVAETVCSEVENDTFYKDIYQNVKKRITSYAETVGKTQVQAITSTLKQQAVLL